MKSLTRFATRVFPGALLVFFFAAGCWAATSTDVKGVSPDLVSPDAVALATSSDASPTSAAPFGFEDVVAKAKAVAAEAYIPPPPLPADVKAWSYDQWRKIRFRPEASLWRSEGLPFEVQFFHSGALFDRNVAINLVEGGRSKPFVFSSQLFRYDESLKAPDESEKAGFAGFRIHYPINRPDYKDEVAAFLGASYFRGVGRGTQYGLSARGLALNTGSPSGEEFPWFREFWLEKPASDDVTLTVYALLDSPSCAGAYRFLIRPGDETSMKEDFCVFFRKPVEKVGIAPLTSMFFYGETENGRAGDYRPEVHDSDGLLLRGAEEGWVWRALRNERRLGVSRTPVSSVHGFGLLQRDRNFDHYQDLEAHYEQRPSLWAEPEEEWLGGAVELIEIPTDSEYNDNIVAFWSPMIEKWDEPFTGAFTFHWGGREGRLHPLGRASATRRGQGDRKGWMRFIVDFEGGELDALPHDAGLTSILEVEGAEVVQKHLEKNAHTGGWRLSFQVAVSEKEGFSVFPAETRTVSLSAFLKKGENFPEPLTETWTYEFFR